MTLMEKLRNRARSRPQRIVLPEGEDPRVVSAATVIATEGFAKITLLGRKQIIAAIASDLHVDLSNVTIVDPAESDRAETYAQIYYERRRAKGASLDESRQIVRRPLYFAALSVAAGDADGSVGARQTRQAKQYEPRCTPSAWLPTRNLFPVFF